MLPPIRDELSLYAGPTTAAGAPSWSLHDPSRNLYFRIDWLTFEILSRWHLGEPDAIARAVCDETPIQDIESNDVLVVTRFLAERELLQRHDAQFSRNLSLQQHQRQRSVWTWLLHHYLFFRVPLLRPDAWLGRWQHRVDFFYQNGFFWLTALALVTGLAMLSRQWDKFSASFVDMFSWQGLGAYAITLVLVKFAHELGHAFTAKRMGCKVPNMGIAFLVMFPMAYTDVNDAWKLPRRDQRLAVGAAGIVTELVIAAWATLAWVLLPDGQLRSGMFLLSSTTWVSTLIINASPFLRFDGYFLLMDWLDMPNLHARAFALARWRLREMLFSPGATMPEALPMRRCRALVLFAIATWVYRTIVFTGIAVLVYNIFPKPLGPFLAAVELGWFVVMPALAEVKGWGRYLPRLVTSWTGLRTLAVLAAALWVSLVPWDTRITGQGILKPQQSFPLIAPGGARIAALPVTNGQAVAPGTELVNLDQVDAQFQQAALRARANSLEWQAKTSGLHAKSREQQQTIAARRAKVEAEITSLTQQQQQYVITAPFAGVMFLTNPELQTGTWVGKNEKIGELIVPQTWRVEAFLDEADIQRLRAGDRGKFYPESGYPSSLEIRLVGLDQDAARELSEGMLASSHGGAIAVREQAKALIPERAIYRVVLEVDTGQEQSTYSVLRGQVVLHGSAQAWLLSHVRTGLAVVRREAGF